MYAFPSIKRATPHGTSLAHWAAREAVELWDWRHQAVRYDAMLRAVLGERQTALGAHP